MHDYFKGGIGASIAMTPVTKALDITADLLDDRLDAIVGDLTTSRDVKIIQSCALGGDMFECGISDTDTAIEVDVCDVICLEVLIDDIDDICFKPWYGPPCMLLLLCC